MLIRWDCIHGAPTFRGPHLLVVAAHARIRDANVEHVSRLHAFELDEGATSIGRYVHAAYDQLILIDLRTAIVRRRHIAPLAHEIVFGSQAVARAQRLSEFDLDTVRFRANGQHLERAFLGRNELLEAVMKLACLAPISWVADAADVERAVRSPDRTVHASFEPLYETKHAALIRTVDLLDVYAL